MKIINAGEIDDLLDFDSLVDALAAAFRDPPNAPKRHHHTKINAGGADQTLLLMPAWNERFITVKLVAVTPDNGKRSLPGVMASVIVMDATTGEQVALIDGARLTLWRTAAASALAARHLAPDNPQTLLVAGTGALAPFLARAHCSVRNYERVCIWGRDPKKAKNIAAQLTASGIAASATADLDDSVPDAQVISTATMAQDPLIKGALLQPGTHLDLVGAFTPAMRESDDDCVRRATLFVDTRAGALSEGGDFVQPIQSGVISAGDIAGDLHELTSGKAQGRRNGEEITLFKSTGAALEDLAAAALVAERAGL